MKPIAHTQTIKIKMIQANTTQTELAEEFGVLKQTVNGWVTGRIAPSLNTALRIAARLDCKVEDLWTYKGDE